MASDELVVGQVFAEDFLVERLLARGGMGAVYAAHQISTGKTRALKLMLLDKFHQTRYRERFQQEARVGARIQSEHVVQVIAAGCDRATGMLWLAMEYLSGEDLSARIERQGRLSREETWEVLSQAGHALAEAHRAGVVHCDLKPENLFVATTRQTSMPFVIKVLDFGIARMLQEDRVSATVTTAVGSPLWMAPEQAARGAQVGPPADVWALGLIAFRLLAGRYYWLAANVPESNINLFTLVIEVANGPLEPASQRLRSLGIAEPLLPDGFDGWFARCVDRRTEGRFANAHDAIVALQPVLRPPVMPPTVTAQRPLEATIAAPWPSVPHVGFAPSAPSWPAVTPPAGAPRGLAVLAMVAAVPILGFVALCAGSMIRGASRGFSCSNGDARVCLALAEDDVRYNDRPTALRHYQKACEHGAAQGCIQRARMLIQGDGPHGALEAASLFQRACNLGDMVGCVDLAAIYERGRPGVAQNADLATRLYGRACEGGRRDACARIGR